MKTSNEISYNILLEVLTNLTTASWQSLGQMATALQKQHKQDKLSTIDTYMLALCSIKDSDSFTERTSLLAKKEPISAISLSIAATHLSHCFGRVLTGQQDQATDDALSFIQLVIASAQSVGFQITDSQTELLLERAHALPARIECQQTLAIAKRSGHLPDKLLFVLGTHRSGTSALTGLLGELGVGLPTDLMPPTADNPKGYWESLSIMNTNEQLLATFGCDWRMQNTLPAGWIDLQPANDWRQQLLKTFQESLGETSFAVIKDPRFCNLIRGLAYWIEDTSIEFSFALLIRHPLEVVSSLLARPDDPIEKEKSLRLWIRSILESERATRSFQRIILIADDLFESPATVEAELRTFLNHSSITANTQEASTFIDISLRHHHGDSNQINMPGIDTVHCQLLEDLAMKIYSTIKADRFSPDLEKLDEFHAVSQNILRH